MAIQTDNLSFEMLPTPDLSHHFLKCIDIKKYVEDTFLLLDALEAEAGRLQGAKIAVCLEVG